MRPDDLDAEISLGGGGLQSMLSQHQLVADAQMEFGGLLSEYRRQQAQQVPPQPEAKTASEARAPQPAQPAQQQPPPQPAPAPQPEAVADSGGQALGLVGRCAQARRWTCCSSYASRRIRRRCSCRCRRSTLPPGSGWLIRPEDET